MYKNKIFLLIASILAIILLVLFFILKPKILDEPNEREQKEEQIEQRTKNNIIEEVENKLLKDEPVEEIEEDEIGATDDLTGKDFFQEMEGEELTIDGLTFKKPELLENALVKGNYAYLIDSTSHYLAFKGFQGYLYIYDILNKQIIPLIEDGEELFISRDERFVFYTKKTDSVEEIFYYDLQAKGFRGQIASAPATLEIMNISFNEGLLYFTYLDDREPLYLTTHVVVFGNENNIHYPIPPIGSVYMGTSFGGGWINEEYYVYDIKNSSISWAQPWNGSLLPRYDVPADIPPTHFISQIQFNEQKEYMLKTSSLDFVDGNVYTKDGQVDGFWNVESAYWVSNKHLLISEINFLYLYNTETKVSTKIKTGVNSVSVYGDTIYYTDLEENTYRILLK